MKNVALINAEHVRELGYTHDNVLPKTITVTIKRVQLSMLRVLMGAKEYDDLITAVSNSLPPTAIPVPLTADQKDLIENYIQPYLVACVDYRIVFPLTLRIKSKSVGKGTDENHVPADLTEMVKLKDQMLKDVDSYAELLTARLNNSSNCPAENNKTKISGNYIKFR